MQKIPWEELELADDEQIVQIAWQKLNVPYVENANALQTLDICIPAGKFKSNTPPPLDEDIWIIFIHGGAWRDPEIAASSFEITQKQLLTKDKFASTMKHVAGLATLNYTLSPYPDHPRLPSVPSDRSRNAKHPDHIHDVLQAIRFLQDEFKFKNRFILLGHSCGATLSFQAVMETVKATSSLPTIVSPIAVVGLAGLYDLANLVKPSGEPQDEYLDVYIKILQNAFGDDPNSWYTASPTSNSYNHSWKNGVSAILAHSPQDTLVPNRQFSLMQECLAELGQKLHKVNLTGEHDEIWKDGYQVAEVIAYAIETVIK